MSSCALTSDIIRRLYSYNTAEGRSTVQSCTPRVKDKDSWGSPRRRLLVHAVVTMAFVCLLRLDEVINLRFEDIQIHTDNHIELTLSSRKTHQYGGLLALPRLVCSF